MGFLATLLLITHVLGALSSVNALIIIAIERRDMYQALDK